MKIKELLTNGIQLLNNQKIQDSAIQARVLLSYVLKMDKNKLIINSEQVVEKSLENDYFCAIKKIIDGKPMQYITNTQEFMKLNFYVDENVLIPQPDTEILVEEVIKSVKQIVNHQLKILDVCTGSGAIGISIAKYIENSVVYVSDISNKALQIAKLNAEKNLVHKKMIFMEADMFKKIDENGFDIIVSNPPYIKTKVIKSLPEEVKEEPFIALDGGKDGLDFYRIIANESYKFLAKNGKLFLEIGYDQKNEVIEILANTGKYDKIECVKDLEENDRVITCIKK